MWEYEFGTVQLQDLVEAAREAAEAGFDVLITCAFNYEAHATEFDKLGCVPVLKARMNADLHMGGELKNAGQGNLFVIFGEPDIDVLDAEDGQVQVRVNGVDVFDPSAGEVRSDDTDGIACWFIDALATPGARGGDFRADPSLRHAYPPISAILGQSGRLATWPDLTNRSESPYRRVQAPGRDRRRSRGAQKALSRPGAGTFPGPQGGPDARC